MADILDELFRRVLDDGECTRAMRESGSPPWTPYPQDDPRAEHLEPEDWGSLPYPPEQWQEDWKVAVMCNAQKDVSDLVDDALDLRDLDVPRNPPEWRMLCRLALITAARAHAINARREWGDYSDGWPDRANNPGAVVADHGRHRDNANPRPNANDGARQQQRHDHRAPRAPLQTIAASVSTSSAAPRGPSTRHDKPPSPLKDFCP